MTETSNERMIDRWFPVAAVDEACGTPTGSGLNEKAIFIWFASRPLAQARAAALTALLPYDEGLKEVIDRAILGDEEAADRLFEMVSTSSGGTPPVVLDVFSGRGIIPLEAGRAGARAIGIDLSPVATLAGRLLADYPLRDWSNEPRLPFAIDSKGGENLRLDMCEADDRLAGDVEAVLAEVDRRLSASMSHAYPKNRWGEYPWGYFWVTTLPCDNCKRRFPLIGSLALRTPTPKKHDLGQTVQLSVSVNEWIADVVDGEPTHEPTYSAALRADGSKRKGKAARCLFCGHVHTLETVKAKCIAREQRDDMIAVADALPEGGRRFRVPTHEERAAASAELRVNRRFSLQRDTG